MRGKKKTDICDESDSDSFASSSLMKNVIVYVFHDRTVLSLHAESIHMSMQYQIQRR